MAVTTWRSTYQQPTVDINGLLNSGALIGKGFSGFGSAIQNVADQRALADLAQYTDAAKLNEALQSGAFAGASENVLAKAMSRPSSLISNAINQESLDYAQKTHPYQINALERTDALAKVTHPTAIANAKRDAQLAAIQNPVTVADAQMTADVANASRKDRQETAMFNALAASANNSNIVPAAQAEAAAKARNIQDTEVARLAMEQVSTLRNSGGMSSAVEANAFLDKLSKNGASKAVMDAVTNHLRSFFGDAVGPVSVNVPTLSSGGIPSSAPTSAISTPAANVIGNVVQSSALPNNIPSVPIVGNDNGKVFEVPTEVGTQLQSHESRLGLPSGIMKSLAFQETSNNPKYFKDPTTYHYPIDSATGKRKSTAFGPFGILESTAKDPGYGVKPLAEDKNLADQTRFASEYLAARIKAAGGDVQKGLAGYGEGVEYAKQVLDRTNGANSVNPTTPPNSDITAIDSSIDAGLSDVVTKLGFSKSTIPLAAAIAESLNQPPITTLIDAQNLLKKDFPKLTNSDSASLLRDIQTKTNSTNFRPVIEIAKQALYNNSIGPSFANFEYVSTNDEALKTGIDLFNKAGDQLLPALRKEGQGKANQAQRNIINDTVIALNNQVMRLQQDVYNNRPGAVAALAATQAQLSRMTELGNKMDNGTWRNNQASVTDPSNINTPNNSSNTGSGSNASPAPKSPTGQPPSNIAANIAKLHKFEQDNANKAAKILADKEAKNADLKNQISWLNQDTARVLSQGEAQSILFEYGHVLTPEQLTALKKHFN